MKNNLSRKLFAVIMALCVVFAYTGFAFADTVEEMTTPGTEAEVTEPVVEEEPVEGTEEPVIEIEEEETEEEPIEVPEPKAKKAVALSVDNEEPEGKTEIKFAYSDLGLITSVQNERTVDGKHVVLYCLESDYIWAKPDTVYNPTAESIVPPEVNSKIQKLLYAGYPCNALGIFDDFSDPDDENYYVNVYLASNITQDVLWYYLSGFDSKGNKNAAVFPNNNKYKEFNPGFYPGYEEQVIKLFEFVESDRTITTPTSASIQLAEESNDSMGTMAKSGDIWSTKLLKITETSGYNLLYEITVPDGFIVRNADGETVTSIRKDTPFTIEYAGNEADIKGKEVSIAATVKYPAEVGYYTTEEKGIKQGYGVVESPYQTMVGSTEASTVLSDKIALSIKPETPAPGSSIIPSAPPAVTPDGDVTDEEPVAPEDPAADDEEDEEESLDSEPMGDLELMSDSDDEDAEADEAEEDISADPMGVKTGDATDMLPWTIGFTAALLGLFVALKARRREN